MLLQDDPQRVSVGEQGAQQRAQRRTLFRWQIEGLGAEESDKAFQTGEVDGPASLGHDAGELEHVSQSTREGLNGMPARVISGQGWEQRVGHGPI